MTEKLKSFVLDDAVFTALLVVIVALVAFVLGRNSMIQTVVQPAGVHISQDETVRVSEVMQNRAVMVVASRSGTKYHLESCPGAQQIKEANKITFSSVEEAQAAGYSPAANCDGL